MVSAQFNISELAKNASKLGKVEAAWLEEKIAKEPWCSAYRILLSKAYFNEDSFLKNKHLRLAATYAGSREVLFNLMHNPELESKEEALLDNRQTFVETEEQVEKEKEASLVHESDAEIHEDLSSISQIEEEKVEEIASEIEVITELREVDKDDTVATENEVEEQAEPEEVTEGSQALIEEEEPHIDFEKLVTYDPTKELKVEPIVSVQAHDPIPFDVVVYNPEVELNKIIEDKEEAEETGEQDFMFWLNHVGDEPKKPKKPKEAIKSPSNVQNLLDQFIATKRSKPIQNREFYNAQNKAQQSETDTMSVISETLLKIYEKQSYFEKAIEGYQKLSLQNPTKSAYFAARITELKEKHKHSTK